MGRMHSLRTRRTKEKGRGEELPPCALPVGAEWRSEWPSLLVSHCGCPTKAKATCRPPKPRLSWLTGGGAVARPRVFVQGCRGCRPQPVLLQGPALNTWADLGAPGAGGAAPATIQLAALLHSEACLPLAPCSEWLRAQVWVDQACFPLRQQQVGAAHTQLPAHAAGGPRLHT